MALTRTFTLGETTYPEAYTRIDSVNVSKQTGAIMTLTYANAAARLANDAPLYTHVYLTFPGQLAGNPLQLAYAFLQRHPDFVGSVVTPEGDDAKPLAMPPTEEVLPPPPPDAAPAEPVSEEFTYPSFQE